MAKTSNDRTRSLPFPGMKRVRQKTVAHCGPAVVEMLVSYLGESIDQDVVVSETGTRSAWFKLYGLNIPQISKAVGVLFPNLQMWHKRESTIGDLSKIINVYKYPVGIEWQGVFDYEDTDPDPNYGEEDDDPGHYSVVTAIDVKKGSMKIADPERHYAGKDRQFEASFFKKRWWDTNDVKVKGLKKTRKIVDRKMMFIIVPKKEKFPKRLGMVKEN